MAAASITLDLIETRKKQSNGAAGREDKNVINKLAILSAAACALLATMSIAPAQDDTEKAIEKYRQINTRCRAATGDQA